MGTREPASEAELDQIESLIDSYLAAELEENPVMLAVDRAEPPVRRWYVRLEGEEKDFTTVWLTIAQRTLRYETYVMPAPEENHAALYERISEWMTGQGWTVTREQIPGEVNGYCTVDGTRRIVVDADLSDAHVAKTAIHEAAHAILHTDDEGKLTGEPDQATRELEAESVAYVVAGLHDLDTSTYSVGYVASWSGGQADKVKATAVRVLDAVHRIAEALAALLD